MTQLTQSLASMRSAVTPLPSPVQLQQDFVLRPESVIQMIRQREAINAIVQGRDRRLLVVVGPCSLHDGDGAREYGQRLSRLVPDLSDRLLVVMRAYVEKPRTTLGWKGLVYDPHLDGSHDLMEGLMRSRQLMVDLVEMGLPLATEALSPMIADYLQDLVSWTAIGARTTESQLHREMASGLPSAVGFKNGTDGQFEVALQAMQASRAGHVFPSLSYCGRPEVRRTDGNPNVHLVLRGGRQGPNYFPEQVQSACAALRNEGLPAGVMIDCSHDNSLKDYRRQRGVIENVALQLAGGELGILGVMIESYLREGKQPLACPLEYGVSITDGCLGWEDTEQQLQRLYQAMGSRV